MYVRTYIYVHDKDTPCHVQMQLFANISPQMPGFNSLPVRVGEQLELGDVLLKVLRFFSVVIILQLLHTHLFSRHLRCTVCSAVTYALQFVQP